MEDDRHNRGTHVAPLSELTYIPQLANALYGKARAEVLERRREATPLHGGFWVFAGLEGQLLGFVTCSPGTHSVLGRHTEADLRVDERYAGVSLRQALLRVRRAEGELVLNLMDLESPSGITLHDARRVRALDAQGPFAASLGGMMMLFVPDEAGLELPEALPVPELFGVEERDVPGARQGHGLVQNSAPGGVGPSLRRDRGHSVISAVAGYSRPSDGSLVPSRRDAGSHVSVDMVAAREAGATAFAVSMEGLDVGTLVLTRAQLTAGVLVGRYGRCWDLGDQPLPSTVSRVHALFIYEDGQLRVLDLGSTNGVTLDDEPLRAASVGRHQRVGIGEELVLNALFVGAGSEA